jgi:hypothetical protein
VLQMKAVNKTLRKSHQKKQKGGVLDFVTLTTLDPAGQ